MYILFPLVGALLLAQVTLQVSEDLSKPPSEQEARDLGARWFNALKEWGKLLGDSFILAIRLAFSNSNMQIPPVATNIVIFFVTVLLPAAIGYTLISRVIKHGGLWLFVVVLGIFGLLLFPAFTIPSFT